MQHFRIFQHWWYAHKQLLYLTMKLISSCHTVQPGHAPPCPSFPVFSSSSLVMSLEAISIRVLGAWAGLNSSPRGRDECTFTWKEKLSSVEYHNLILCLVGSEFLSLSGYDVKAWIPLLAKEAIGSVYPLYAINDDVLAINDDVLLQTGVFRSNPATQWSSLLKKTTTLTCGHSQYGAISSIHWNIQKAITVPILEIPSRRTFEDKHW